MAVTQQLARLAEEHVARCAADVEVLEEVCSFRALASTEYTDLDWAPSLLDKAAVRAGIEPALIEGLHRSTDCDRKVNPAYDGTWETPTYWDSTATQAISALLDAIDPSILLDPAVIRDVTAGTGLRDPLEYATGKFTTLCNFYNESATRRLAVMLWLD